MIFPLHEPITTGWLLVLVSFAHVIFTGMVFVREATAKYQDSIVMSERMKNMERLYKMQQMNFEFLNERVEETKTICHDLRHHFVAIEGFLQNREYENLEAYIRRFNDLDLEFSPVVYSQNPAINVIVSHFARYASKEGIKLTLRLDVDANIKVLEADLCVILSNLLENALESCMRQDSGERFVILSIGQKPSFLAINIENSTDGNVAQSNGMFISSKARDRKGYGLYSVCAIASRYQGDADFQANNQNKVFKSKVVLGLRR